MPRLGSSVWGSVGVTVLVLRAELRLTGYLLTTSFPTTVTVEFKKFPLEVRYTIILDSFISINGSNICTCGSVATYVFVLVLLSVDTFAHVLHEVYSIDIDHFYAHRQERTHAGRHVGTHASTDKHIIYFMYMYMHVYIHMHVRTHARTHAQNHERVFVVVRACLTTNVRECVRACVTTPLCTPSYRDIRQ